VYFGNDGGVYRTDDIDQTGRDPDRAQGWVSLNNGYGVTLFYDVAGNPQTGTLVAGAQDNGTFRYTQVEERGEWTRIYGGDGGVCAADPNDPMLLYGEYVFLELFRTSPTGKSVAFINGIRSASFANQGAAKSFKPFPYQIPDAASGRVNFIAPFVVDPQNANRILAGGLSLWRTNDAKAEVTLDEQRVFVAFLSFTRENVWLTTDGGTTWKNVGATLPQTGVRTVAIHPRRSEWVYLGTDVGVFASEDGGLTWSPTNNGPANCRVDKLTWLGEKLIAATFGRGIYSIEVKP
jgi:hypothetical protein